MTTATTLALASTLATARTDINEIIGTQKTEAIKFADSSRKRTYRIAQRVLIAGRVLLAEGNEAELSALLLQNKVKVRAGSNPWAYVLALTIPEDKTWANRAGAMRALHKWSNEKSTDGAADFIDKFTIQSIKTKTQNDTLIDAIGTSDAKRMDGLALLDRIENRKDGDPTDGVFLKTAIGSEKLDLSATHISDTKVEFVMVWAKVTDGKVIPMGVVENSQAAAKKEAISTGRTLYGKAKPAEVKAAVEEKIGDFVFGDELGSTTEPAVVREEGEFIEVDA